LRALGLETFSSYYDILTGDSEKAKEELTHFVNGITTNKTDFYREPYQFEFLKNVALKEKCDRSFGSQDRELRIWSAGCSTGEEPYTLSIILNEYFRDIPSMNVKILATDLDTDVLSRAKRGVYSEQAIKPIPRECLIRYFKRGIGVNEGSYMAKQNLKNMITFAKHNLVKSPMRVKKPFDMVFCRNVLIYFDGPTTDDIIFKQFYNVLKPGGYLFLGHSEALPLNNHCFKRVANSVYQKH
jgi:chemotaxis protein methyltransferase CheR